MDTAGLPEMDGAAAARPGSQKLGSDQEAEPGRRAEGSFETVAVVGQAGGLQAEGLQAGGCILQGTAYRTAAAVGHLVAEEGIHLEPGTAGTPDHPFQLGDPAVLQRREPVAGGALLVEVLQKRRKQCCQEFLTAPLLQPLGWLLRPGPRLNQRQR